MFKVTYKKSTSGDMSLHNKATEHVIGNVRCAPGCCSFSYFTFSLTLSRFHFHYTSRQLNMWLAMSDVLLVVFHFSAPPLYGRTRAPTKKLLQWSICTLLWQKGTINCLPVELSLLAYRRLEFQNIVCSILSFFFRGHECLVYDLGEDLWLCMMIIQVWISQWPDESRETKIPTKPFNPARLEDPVLCSGRRLHPVPWGTFGVPEATTTLDCVRQNRNERALLAGEGGGGDMTSFCNNQVTF